MASAGVCGGTGNHGFSFTIPDSVKNGVAHQIYAYGINIGSGNTNPALSSLPLSLACAVSAPAALKKSK